MPDYYQPLQSNTEYHIYNCGNNNELLFKDDWQYNRFLKKVKIYIGPIANIYAYCLLPDHFHLALRFKDPKELYKVNPKRFPRPLDIFVDPDRETGYYQKIAKGLSLQFSDLFNSHTKTINLTSPRKGKLFCLQFKRILVDNEAFRSNLICYIHRNPIHHDLSRDFESWPYSSYTRHINGNDPLVDTSFVVDWFRSLENYIAVHRDYKEAYLDSRYFVE